jgi:hypothetical protein
MMPINSSIYPYIREEKGRFIPVVKVPMNFREIVRNLRPEHYSELESYVKRFRNSELKINWDENLGLKFVSLAPSKLELDAQRFEFVAENVHSLDDASLLFAVATKYVSLLVNL